MIFLTPGAQDPVGHSGLLRWTLCKIKWEVSLLSTKQTNKNNNNSKKTEAGNKFFQNNYNDQPANSRLLNIQEVIFFLSNKSRTFDLRGGSACPGTHQFTVSNMIAKPTERLSTKPTVDIHLCSTSMLLPNPRPSYPLWAPCLYSLTGDVFYALFFFLFLLQMPFFLIYFLSFFYFFGLKYFY